MDDRPWSELASEVRAQRARLQRKQKDVARAVGISINQLQRIERGQEPPYSIALRLFKELGIPDPHLSPVENRLSE